MSLENVSLVGKEGRVSISKEGVAVCHIFDGELHPPILPTRGDKLPTKYTYILYIYDRILGDCLSLGRKDEC